MKIEDLEKAVDKWRGQSRKGFVELCILGYIESSTDTYGFAMLESLRRAGLDIGEGTLYPLLNRLVKEGMLESSWKVPEEGHPRKYYGLTDYGRDFLEQVLEERKKDQRAFEAIFPSPSAGMEVDHE